MNKRTSPGGTADWVHSNCCIQPFLRDELRPRQQHLLNRAGNSRHYLSAIRSRLRLVIEVTIIYKIGNNRLGRFPEAVSEHLLASPKRNFQVFDPLDFLAEVTHHIPDPRDYLIRY